MKFSKELENEAVPEWKAKYFNYRQGKKKIKAIVKAERGANSGSLRTPKTPLLRRQSSGPTQRDSPSRTPFIPIRRSSSRTQPRYMIYGSIVASPPSADTLSLPAPAVETRRESVAPELEEVEEPAETHASPTASATPVRPPALRAVSAYESGHIQPSLKSSLRKRLRFPSGNTDLLKSMFGRNKAESPYGDITLDDWRAIESRTEEFRNFLDSELDKIEKFFEQKESEATVRLENLKKQLHHLRDQRTAKDQAKAAELAEHGHEHQHKALLRRDYVRHPTTPEASYRSAKTSLRRAMEDFYRGLELLVSYAQVNREAFRKINKKFDKATLARPTMAYYNGNVKGAVFVQGEVVERQIQEVLDLYARYFLGGNTKAARRRLEKARRPQQPSPTSSFVNGLLLSIGSIAGINGIVKAVPKLFPLDPFNPLEQQLKVETSYLLQLYAGYFLMMLVFLLFCLACWLFKECHINYQLVFEFEPRSQLAWTELTQIPLFCIALCGITMWCNFSDFGPRTLEYVYWPLVLIGITLVLLFMPAKTLYFKTRRWFLHSLFRLWFCAGLIPVEFRDLILGDMFCSLTYAMGNIELFFCLYTHRWGSPTDCNSSHSRLLGFFQALPGIWRFLQCLRRVMHSTGEYRLLNAANAGKYAFTIAGQASLSVYRISRTDASLAAFIFVSAINSIYTSVWDLLMDWSLGDAKHGYLRPVLGFQKHKWMYYAAAIIDPMLRCNWIPYAALQNGYQHSAITSFAISLSEVLRRSMWLLFRVENEHCTNVRLFRAHQERTLPYEIRDEESNPQPLPQDAGTPSGLVASSGASIRRVGTYVSTTHAQDFVRKRPSFVQHDSDDDDEDDEDGEDEAGELLTSHRHEEERAQA